MTLLRAATVISGKYRLDREFARGGMGSIWLARHIQLDMPVAIKFMDAGLPEAADGRARFKREARSAALIRSPHVVQILDHGIDGEVPYIVMELLDGEHLGARLRREGRISLSAAATIVTQVAKALKRAHGAGIIHRDLKPANIFLARTDEEEDEIVKILDFGIAKAVTNDDGNETTKTGVLMGSPNYMSPEQARGSKSIDHRSDLFSLGVILFRAITGEMAFTGESEVDIILKICVGPAPVPSHVAPDLPPEVDTYFERALAREPAQRFQSAREMAAELNDLVARLGPRADVVGPRRSTVVDKESATAPGSGDYQIPKPPLPAELPLWRRLLEGATEPETSRAGGMGTPRTKQQLPPTLREHTPDEDRPSKATVLTNTTASRRPIFRSTPDDEAPASSRARAYAAPSADDNPLAALRARAASGESARPQQEKEKPQPFRASLFGGALAGENSPASIRAIMMARGRQPENSPASIHARMAAKSREFDTPPQSMHASALARLSALEDPFAPVLASGLAKLASADTEPLSTRRGSDEDHHGMFSRMIEGAPSSRPPPPNEPPTDPTGQIARRFDQGFMALKTALQNSTRSGESQPPELVAKISALVDQGFSALKTGDRQTARRCWREALTLDPTNRRLELNLKKLEAKIG